MYKLISLFVFPTLIASSLFAGLPAPATPAASKGLSPAGFLNADGTLRLGGGFSGAFDLSGWDVRLDPQRGPVLAPDTVSSPGWNALGSGLNDFVYGIVIIGNNVYAGGGFTNAGGNDRADYIAKWNGSNWSEVGSGLNGSVLDITISGGDMYVGGWFTDAGKDPDADYIAKWDGADWSAVGGGLNSYVTAIAVSGSNVYAGGGFIDAGGNANADYIAKWNGSTWSALGSGLNASVVEITISGSNVYVGGGFTDAGGHPNADRIAKWNGSNWSALGSGLNDWPEAIVISGSDMYVGGFFTDAGGNVNADRIARWNGSNWFALGNGLNDAVFAVAISGSNIYAGGYFTNAGGDPNADRIAKWNGSNWSALESGVDNEGVYIIALSGKNVYAGGWFTDAGGNASADYIAFYGVPTQSFRSQSNYDGWVLESSETSGVGGTKNSTATTFYLGDNAQKKQYRGILSFKTAGLPDSAVITRVTLKIKKQGLVGTDPFTTHGNIAVDIRAGAFGGNNALQLTDFQAASSKNAAGIIRNTPASGWYRVTFGSSVFTYVNRTGITQFRLRFRTDDDNDTVADYLKFYSGNAGTASYRPQLIIEYYVP
jgi:hypothetical protein